MPDWSSDSDYGFTHQLSASGWAWEFLRRNPGYRSDYEECAPLDLLWQQETGREKEHCIFVPRRRGNETWEQWRTRVILEEDGPPHAYRPARFYALRWPLAELIRDPENDSPPRFKIPGDYPRLLQYEEALQIFEPSVMEVESTEDSSSCGEESESQELSLTDAMEPTAPLGPYVQVGPVAAVTLDLNRSFDAQLPSIREIFSEEKDARATKGTRFDANRWTLYLRILDAKAEEITSQEICSNIHQQFYDPEHSHLANKEINRLAKQARYLTTVPGIYAILAMPIGPT